MSIFAAFSSLGVSLKNVFREANTVPLPWNQVRPRGERFRSSFALIHNEHGDEACIGCQMCERICPSQVISVEPGPRAMSPNTGKKRGWHKDFTIDLNACIFCELCVQVCPTDSIVMLRVTHPPGFSRNDQVLDRHHLYANESSAHSWANGSKLSAMQAPPPKKKAPPPTVTKPVAPKPVVPKPVVPKPVVDGPTELPTAPISPVDLPEPTLHPPSHTKETD